MHNIGIPNKYQDYSKYWQTNLTFGKRNNFRQILLLGLRILFFFKLADVILYCFVYRKR